MRSAAAEAATSVAAPRGLNPADAHAALAHQVAAAAAPAAVQATGRVAAAAGGLQTQELLTHAREILERVAWEVVPPLAEALIKEHIERLARR
jgi:hypothetical protein